MAFVGTDGHFFVDEAAHYAQIELVEHGTWLAERPFAEQDPTGRHAPMDRAELSGTDEYAPFVYHPLSVWIGVGADRLGGRVGVRAVSVLGVVGAAAAAAALAHRFRAGSGPLALWLTGLASPLVFDSQLIVAHALGAAVVGGAAVLWMSRRPTALVVVGLAGAAAVGVLLRSEVVLLAAAVVLVGGGLAVRGRRLDLGARVVAVAVGTVAAYLSEPVWIERIVDAPSVGPRTISSGARGGFDTLWTVLLRPSYDGLARPATDLLLLLAVLLAASGALLAARRRIDLSRPLLVAAALAAAVRLGDPAVTSGLLLAFPALTVAVVLVATRVHRPRGAEAALLAAGVVFAGAVAATQYDEAGGFEWGWRYVAIAVPLVVPSIAGALLSLRDRVGGRAGTDALALILAVSMLVVVSGVVEQRAVVDRTDGLRQRLEVLAADEDRLLFLDPLLGRAMWQLSIAGRVVQSEVSEAGEVLEWMRDAGETEVLVVWVGSDTVPLGAGDFEIGTVTDLGVSDLRAAQLRL